MAFVLQECSREDLAPKEETEEGNVDEDRWLPHGRDRVCCPGGGAGTRPEQREFHLWQQWGHDPLCSGVQRQHLRRTNLPGDLHPPARWHCRVHRRWPGEG